MADFATLVPDALGFFEDLAQNNDRDWFAAEKPRYEAVVKRPAEALLDTLGAWLTAETGRAQTPKLYRINRDLRFSKDKTPYNTHLHLQWSDPATGIAHLFGVSRGYVCAGLGAMAFDKAALLALNAALARVSKTPSLPNPLPDPPPVPISALADVRLIERVAGTLAAHFGLASMQIEADVGRIVGETAAVRAERRRRERDRRAREAIEADPFVRSVLDELGGSIVPESIRPLDAPTMTQGDDDA